MVAIVLRFSSSFLILQKLSVEHDLVFYLKDPNIIVITYYYSFIYVDKNDVRFV